MKRLMSPYFVFAFILTSTLLLTGCGGTKILDNPEPLQNVNRPLVNSSDHFLSVTLDWVIFRDGPGSWARNVDWDEYLINVANLTDENIEVIDVVVVDSLGNKVHPRYSRRQLVEGSKLAIDRYEDKGLEVKAGFSGTTLMGASIAGAGALSATTVTLASSAATTLSAFAVLVAVPVFAAGGAVRGLNNRKVNDEIESRQTPLPMMLQGSEEKSLVIFFPISPSPQQLELIYRRSFGEQRIVINTQNVLKGLHLPDTE